MSTPPFELLDALVAEAVTGLQRAGCGAPVCAADRDNRPVAGVKRAEGRWAALRGVQRETGRSVDLADALERARGRWHDDLARHGETGSGRDWVAYCGGGVEALDEFTELVSARSTSREAHRS